MNSDILTDINFGSLLKKHSNSNNLTTITTSKINIKSEFGVVKLNNNKITAFHEKPFNKAKCMYRCRLFQ